MALMLCALGLRAQDYQMNLHRSGEVIFENGVNTIVDIRFEGSQPANMLINLESGTTTFPITRFDSITFSMPTEYTITVDANNNAWGTVSGGGVYYAGTTCNLSATPASGYQFDSWKKNGVVVSLSPDYSFTVTESATYTAYFAETPAVYYTVTTNVSPTGAGTVTGGGIYPEGTTVTLTATANSGYTFSQWQDGSTTNPLTITVTQNATYTAFFAEVQPTYYTITTNVSPTGAGTVSGGGTYPEGATATLTATANSGYTFSQWQDGSTTNPRTITVTQNATYTAFFAQEQPPAGDTVFIVYNGSSVAVTNPFESTGVTVETSNANVTVNSTRNNVPYVVSGSSSNGSLTIYSSSAFYLALSSLNLTSSSTAAINLASNVSVTLALRGTSSLTDNANSPLNGALVAAGDLTVGGATLNVTGNGKHGIAVEGTMTVNSGTINILSTDSDGIHGSSALVWNGGTLNITAPGSDGLDFSGAVTINAGSLTINTTTLSQRSIKVSGIFTMTGGSLDLNVSGNDCKGIKGDMDVIISGGTVDLDVSGTGSNGISSDTDVIISGNANVTIVLTSEDGKCIKSDGTVHVNGGTIGLTHSGNISKGVKAVGDITISSGTINITSSGNTVVSNNDPAYCTAIKSDANITISGGNITINLPTSNHGGKGISATGTMTISGSNTINIETHGDGATYTASSGTDTYSSSCLRSEGNMQILSGTITLNSTGKGGKGIKVGTKNGNTYSGTYTQGTSNGSGPTLTITTSGAQVSGGGGGGWPPGPGGGGSVKASAKAIKVGGLATINGGSTSVSTTSTGAEGLESKTQILINGGQHYFHCYDDCINSSGSITFEGGVTVCFSNGNDAVDSNAGSAGAITIGNGVAFAYTNRGNPEEGFDCDNNNYIRITGTGIGISAGGSQGGGGGPGGGGSGGTIPNAAQGYKFYTSSYTFQTGRYYTLSNSNGSGGTNMVTFSFESNVSSSLALITATGMVSGNTYYVKYGTQAPTNPTTAFHGLYLGGTSSASTQAFSFTAQ